MKTYKVYLYEGPYIYKVKADNQGEAEYKAIKQYNGGDESAIGYSKINKLINSKGTNDQKI